MKIPLNSMMEFYSQKMSTKHIISTINVILALLVRFSIQLNLSQSDSTYQDLNEWSLETNLLEFNDDSNEQLLAFSEFQFSPSFAYSVFFFPAQFRLPPSNSKPPTEHLRLCKFFIFFSFSIHHSLCALDNILIDTIHTD